MDVAHQESPLDFGSEADQETCARLLDYLVLDGVGAGSRMYRLSFVKVSPAIRKFTNGDYFEC